MLAGTHRAQAPCFSRAPPRSTRRARPCHSLANLCRESVDGQFNRGGQNAKSHIPRPKHSMPQARPQPETNSPENSSWMLPQSMGSKPSPSTNARSPSLSPSCLVIKHASSQARAVFSEADMPTRTREEGWGRSIIGECNGRAAGSAPLAGLLKQRHAQEPIVFAQRTPALAQKLQPRGDGGGRAACALHMLLAQLYPGLQGAREALAYSHAEAKQPVLSGRGYAAKRAQSPK